MLSSRALRTIVINVGTVLVIIVSIITANSIARALAGLRSSGLVFSGIKLVGSTTFFISVALASAIHRSFPPKHDRPEDFERLYTEGPYQLCRHPFYFFLMLIQISIPLIFLSAPGLLLALAFIPLWYALAKVEEEELINYWDTMYLEYKKRVPMLIPLKIRRG